MVPEHVDIDVALFVDGLDVPGRSIILRGGPHFVAKYSIEEGEIKKTTYQQSWMMGRLIVDLEHFPVALNQGDSQVLSLRRV